MITVNYDSSQEKKLWLFIKMYGNFYITYTWNLWASNSNEKSILTKTTRSGSNFTPHDDVFNIINDYDLNESLDNFDRRVIDLNFWVKLKEENTNYEITVEVFQAELVTVNNKGKAEIIDGNKISNDEILTINKPAGIDNGTFIQENIMFKLLDIA